MIMLERNHKCYLHVHFHKMAVLIGIVIFVQRLIHAIILFEPDKLGASLFSYSLCNTFLITDKLK